MLALAVKDHNNPWRSDLGVLGEGHADEIARLNNKIVQRDEELAKLRVDVGGDLRATARGIGNGPLTESVRRWFESERVEDAEKKRDSAYRSRDYAYAVMCGTSINCTRSRRATSAPAARRPRSVRSGRSWSRTALD